MQMVVRAQKHHDLAFLTPYLGLLTFMPFTRCSIGTRVCDLSVRTVLYDKLQCCTHTAFGGAKSREGYSPVTPLRASDPSGGGQPPPPLEWRRLRPTEVQTSGMRVS
jgi:hypothetical protein